MRYTILFLLATIAIHTTAQKSTSIPQLGSQIITDSASTLMMPVLYDVKLFDSATKLALFDNYYANIMFYNFVTDSAKMLFDHNVFISAFDRYSYSFSTQTNYKDFISAQLIFYRVRHIDLNKNKKIDNEDPSILYVSDKNGNNLHQITNDTVNVVDVKLYDKQSFAMIKIQRDSNGSNSFDYHDKQYYYVKLDLKTLHLGREIEL